MRWLCLVPPRDMHPEGLPDRLYGCSYSYDYKPPLHLCLLGTLLQEAGHEVRLLDAIAEGMDAAAFSAFIERERHDAVLFFTPYVASKVDLAALAMLRARWGEHPWAIWTGAAPSWRPDDFLHGDRDLVLRGEPEPGLRALSAHGGLDPDPARVPGLSMRREGALIAAPRAEFCDVAALPAPDRTLMRGRYRVNRLNVAPVTAALFSRGCAYSCLYCAPMALDQAIEVEYKKEQSWYDKRPPLRLRDAQQVVAEFRAIAALGYRGVEVADNVFHWSRERTLAICRGIEDLGLEWLCLGRAPQMQDEEVLDAMAKAGCRLVYMGTESFDQELLDDCRKRQPVASIEEAVRKMRRAGIEPEISVLLGASPKESADTARDSIDKARALGTRFVHYGFVTPFPNTEYYDLARREGWMKERDYQPGDMIHQAQVDLPHLSHEDMHALATNAVRRHYLAPATVWQHLKRVRSLRDLAHKTRMFLKWLRHVTPTRAMSGSNTGRESKPGI